MGIIEIWQKVKEDIELKMRAKVLWRDAIEKKLYDKTLKAIGKTPEEVGTYEESTARVFKKKDDKPSGTEKPN